MLREFLGTHSHGDHDIYLASSRDETPALNAGHLFDC
jgi:hypothetical protein